MVPVCSSGTLINVLPHRNAMPQTQDMTPQPVTVYRHGANLSLCYLLMWNNCLLARRDFSPIELMPSLMLFVCVRLGGRSQSAFSKKCLDNSFGHFSKYDLAYNSEICCGVL